MSADVRSIDALRDWHADLTTFGSDLAEALAGTRTEIRRGFDWLAEQLGRWQRAIRDCEQEVVQAKAELAARKMPDWSGRDPDTTVQEKALRVAKARLEYAEDQVARIRSWTVRLPKLIDEVYSGTARRLGGLLEVELPAGLALLARRIEALESYAGLRPDYAPGPSTATLPTAPPPPAPANPGRESGEENPAPRAPANPAPRAPANPAPRAPANPAPRAPANPAPHAPANPAPRAPANPAPRAPANPGRESGEEKPQ